MKPTLLNNTTNRRSFHSRANGFPKTDYQFQPDSMTEFRGRCRGNSEPSFRGISRNYFKDEAPGAFFGEAAIFVLIAVTAAVAIVQGVRVASAFGLL